MHELATEHFAETPVEQQSAYFPDGRYVLLAAQSTEDTTGSLELSQNAQVMEANHSRPPSTDR
jgi:hypothetical protein